MKLIIKERKKTSANRKFRLVLKESTTATTGNEFTAQIAPQDFINLTYSPQDQEDIEARKKSKGQFSLEKAGELLLVIGRDGKVLQHSGRYRSSAAKDAGIAALPIKIRLEPPEIKWQDVADKLTNQFGVSTNQDGQSTTVNKEVIKNISTQEKEQDLYRRLFYDQQKQKMQFFSGIDKLDRLKHLVGMNRFTLAGSETPDEGTKLESYDNNEPGVFKLARLSKNVKDKFAIDPSKIEGQYEILTIEQLIALGLK